MVVRIPAVGDADAEADDIDDVINAKAAVGLLGEEGIPYFAKRAVAVKSQSSVAENDDIRFVEECMRDEPLATDSVGTCCVDIATNAGLVLGSGMDEGVVVIVGLPLVC